MTTPKERPILFNAAMVNAIQYDRKTKTRRIVTGNALEFLKDFTPEFTAHPENHFSPLGYPEDRLWVRETWAHHPDFPESTHRAIYRADRGSKYDVERWTPSIHMPRWASRITLDVIAVRIERLQDISDQDALAEGIRAISKDGATYKYGIPDADGLPGNDNHGWHWQDWQSTPRDAFRKLWESIYGADSWAANPWVWVTEFKRS